MKILRKQMVEGPYAHPVASKQKKLSKLVDWVNFKGMREIHYSSL
jgi:hypothetical protein